MKRIIRVNTRTGEVIQTAPTEEDLKWGGRGFIARTLLNEVPPTCEPLGRYNKLIISLGLFADTNLSTAGRLSIGGKSPLTGGVKECNVGGNAGKRLGRIGVKALILEDIPEKDTTRILYVSADEVKLIDAPHLKGKLVDETFEELRKEFGERKGFICIGPAGEMKLYAAGIALTDDRGEQVRYAARGGLGAVMGSKGIKAIVIDDSKTVEPDYYDAELLNSTVKEVVKILQEDPKSQNRRKYGTLDILELANQAGLLPTRNFSSGQFELAANFSGPRVADVIKERGGCGKSGTACVPGCTIMCSNVFPDKEGKKIVASLQYESVVLLGPNCGIGDLDDVAELNHLCNQVGVDTIECGAAIGVAMEAGVINFGDAEGAKDIVKQIGQGTYLGRIIGNGAEFTGRAFGVRRVPAVKGQAMPAYDPRGLKGNGVLYATSTMGADHTAGNAFETLKTVNPLGKEKQVYNSRQLQIRAALIDSLGVCLFIRPAFIKNRELLSNLYKGRYGFDMSFEEIKRTGVEVLEMERRFNELAGVSEKIKRMPEFMREEPLPPNNTVFDISQEELEEIWNIEMNPETF
ncbi:aldehyde ferredoxin oxidoreductase C-terminal domain-containing protein [Thermovenabulum gondwanense]|uniref:Putative oxidoreductase YdhV n=1 Tax=Thermovenabulum gondwanense TaxID=520767 RepID=A0A161PWX4_9FIRM|nr:aldehyde ferredoxin oxidoreductase C-terminal domain-containing protein [Thermovenabulum gondwanense]KYO68080.1 putative oxidoreductase YdhV [Thermovenabulum gondwanense]